MRTDQIIIVFVHLNGEIPRYLKSNLISTALKFPANKVVLLTNRKQKWWHKKVTVVVQPDTKWREWSLKLSHPVNFRNNFWFTSIARFFALEEFLEASAAPLLHIESDVIVAKNLPLDDFLNGKNDFAFPLVSVERGVASVVYIKNLKAIKHFNNYAKNEMLKNPSTSDMLILGSYFNSFPSKVQVLPTAPGVAEAFRENVPPKIKKKIIESFEIFRGIVDGNDLGMYFYGTDPRNLRGKSILYRAIDSSFLRVEDFLLHKSKKSELPFLTIKGNEKRFPIFAIHATCKDNRLFDYKLQESKLASKAGEIHKSEKKLFVVSVMITQFLKSLTNRLYKVFK